LLTLKSSPAQSTDWTPTQLGGLLTLKSSPAQSSDWTPQ
ncbi:hypothetical protein A2U01_0119414, partial [Trifolium medium]|nr:hypothetical protein [Trifolium medium]